MKTLTMSVRNGRGELMYRLKQPESDLREQGVGFTSQHGQLTWTCTLIHGTTIVATCKRGVWDDAPAPHASKPHEETWEVYQSGKANHGIYRKNPRRTVATRIATYDEAMLLSAAPDMARVLLRVGYACMVAAPGPDCECTKCQIRAALIKAGIIDGDA